MKKIMAINHGIGTMEWQSPVQADEQQTRQNEKDNERNSCSFDLNYLTIILMVTRMWNIRQGLCTTRHSFIHPCPPARELVEWGMKNTLSWYINSNRLFLTLSLSLCVSPSHPLVGHEMKLTFHAMKLMMLKWNSFPFFFLHF